MVQQPSSPADSFNSHQGLAQAASDTSTQSGALDPVRSRGLAAAAPRPSVRTYLLRQLMVLEVEGRLGAVVEELDLAIQLALAEGPRGVLCDLSGVLDGAEPGAVDLLATAGRHARDWSGMPVALAWADPKARETLAAHPLGRYVIVTPTMFSAASAVLATQRPVVERLRLSLHPSPLRASRDFVTRTLLAWQLGGCSQKACSVVSELVASSTSPAGCDIDVSVAFNQGALRLAVRDHSPRPPHQRYPCLGLHGRGLTVVAGLSRAFGVLPGAEGGKAVWAVLHATLPRPAAASRLAVTWSIRRATVGLSTIPY